MDDDSGRIDSGQPSSPLDAEGGLDRSEEKVTELADLIPTTADWS